MSEISVNDLKDNVHKVLKAIENEEYVLGIYQNLTEIGKNSLREDESYLVTFMNRCHYIDTALKIDEILGIHSISRILEEKGVDISFKTVNESRSIKWDDFHDYASFSKGNLTIDMKDARYQLDMIKINNSDLFLYTGTVLEPWTESIISSLEDNSKLYDISNGIDLIRIENFEEKHINSSIKYDKVRYYMNIEWRK